MKLTIFTEEQQKLFRRVIESKAQARLDAIQELIEQKLDEESAIIPWLYRIGCHTHYESLKNASIARTDS